MLVSEGELLVKSIRANLSDFCYVAAGPHPEYYLIWLNAIRGNQYGIAYLERGQAGARSAPRSMGPW